MFFKGPALQCASERTGLGILVLINTLSASFGAADLMANHLEVPEHPPLPCMELSLHAQVSEARPLWGFVLLQNAKI
jgi:hypothetical protein